MCLLFTIAWYITQVEGAQLFILVRDVDPFGVTELVDEIYLQGAVPIDPEFTDAQIFTGSYDRSEIVLSFRLQCVVDFYGSDCATQCISTDDESGRYTCSSTGAIVCLNGWSNPTGSCLTRESLNYQL